MPRHSDLTDRLNPVTDRALHFFESSGGESRTMRTAWEIDECTVFYYEAYGDMLYIHGPRANVMRLKRRERGLLNAVRDKMRE